jgi:hypothetical protein
MTKTKKNLVAIGLWIFIWANSAFVFWLSGFDFDHRGGDVAFWYVGTGVVSFVLGLIFRALIEDLGRL